MNYVLRVTSMYCNLRRFQRLISTALLNNQLRMEENGMRESSPHGKVKIEGTDEEFKKLEEPNSSDFEIEKTRTVKLNDKSYTQVKEGKAEILYPITGGVFYNPVQEFNRDLSIAVINTFIKIWKREKAQPTSSKRQRTNADEDKITLLEAFSASGLRAVRYALEVPGIDHITANDMSSKAVETITTNIEYNRVGHIVKPSHEEASLLMYQHRSYTRNQYAIIDLDPYGSAAPFLDAAVQSVTDGGLLLITCTDLAVLCGNGSEKCHANYGAMSLKTKCCHEMALRIVLQSVESHANRYGRYIVPLLSLSADFYVRMFVRIFTSPSKVKQTPSKLAMVYHCKGCEMMTFQPIGRTVKTEKGSKEYPSQGPPVDKLCEHCNHQHYLGGPIWIGPIHDKEFLLPLIKSISPNETYFTTAKRMFGMLNVMFEELEDAPLYYCLDRLASILHSQSPKMSIIRSAIMNAGYRVSYSHACRTSVKTDAPPGVLWDILRSWVAQNPLKRKLKDGEPAKIILDKALSIDVSFEKRDDAKPASLRSQLVRFQLNPEPNWGPKARPRSIANEIEKDKSRTNQGKHSKTSESSDYYKQFPCKRFKEDNCEKGDTCRYSHDPSALGLKKNEDKPCTQFKE